MEIIGPAFTLIGAVFLSGFLLAIVATILVVLNQHVPPIEKLLLIIMIWMIPIIGSITAIVMLVKHYKQKGE